MPHSSGTNEEPAPGPADVVEVEAGSQVLKAVIRLGNGPAKRWLGPMPDAGFADRARKGTLLAAVEASTLLGYVLYDLPRNRVKIRQVCVAEAARGRGLARKLVEEVSRRHPRHRGIEVVCRRDYPANGLWERLGFRPVNSRIGRSRAQHPLTVWFLDHGHPDLFSSGASAPEQAALDHMVFLDLVEDPTTRPHGEASRELLADWLAEYIELCVTDEVFHEIDRVPDTRHRRALQEKVGRFVLASRGTRLDDDLVRAVGGLAPDAGPADHRHIARAVSAAVTYFITRDTQLLRAATAMERELSVVVLRPEDLIARIDRMRSQGRYLPRALQQTALQQAAIGEGDIEPLARSVLNYGTGERAHVLRDSLSRVVAAPDRYDTRVVRDADDRIVGVYANRAVRSSDDAHLEVPLLRVPGLDSIAVALARQLAFEQRRTAAAGRYDRVILTDASASPAVLRALEREQFQPSSDGHWICEVRTGLVVASEICADENDHLRERAIAHERSHWPQKVVDAGIASYLVPIKVAYAEQLLDPGLAARTLLPRQTHLGLGREHVYYRRPRNHGGIAPGARILWYVTGSAPSHSRGSVRALSTVDEVVVGPATKLFHRFERLGVYTHEEVKQAADRTGDIMAIRFVDTEVLAQPISLDALRQRFGEAELRFAAPQAPRLIPERLFCQLYRESSGYGP